MRKTTIKKSQAGYNWSQTDESLTISLPVRNVSRKDVDVIYAEFVLKVNVTATRYVQIIDFPFPIDFANTANQIQLTDDSLEVFLIKKDQNVHWTELQLTGLNQKELIERRNKTLSDYYAWQKAEQKKTLEVKYEMDHEATRQQMAVESHQRDHIENTKKAIHDRETDILQGELDALEAKNKQLSDKARVMSYQENLSSTERAAKYKKQRQEDIFGEADIQTIPSKKPNQESSRKAAEQVAKDEDSDEPKVYEVTEETEVATTANDEDDVENQAPNAPEADLPQVREKQEVKMGFTEKKFAHLPARESQLKEPPYPKSKNLEKKDKDVYIDVEDTDPVWLKDKGDHWFKRFDYNAALNAYTKAIKQDPEFLMGRLNRATCFIKLRGFVAAIDDCTDIVTQIEKLKNEEYESDKGFYDKVMARALVKRGAAQSWVSAFDESIADFEKILANDTYCAILGQLQVDQLKRDLILIQNRKLSQEIKFQGDTLFYQENFDGALEKYLEALEKDTSNEYALSNIGVIYLMRHDHENSIKYETLALEKINSFMNETKSFSQQNQLEMKLLLRRAKSHQCMLDYEKSKADLDRLLILEPAHSEANQLLKVIQKKLDEVTFAKYKDEANELLKKREFSKALDLYEKALKVTRKATTLENIGVYVNKIACLLAQEKFEKVIQECNEAIRLIRNFKNRFQPKGADAERLKQMDLRVAVRRGNALGKLARTTEAIAEYERALKIDPSNAAVQRDLDVLRKAKA